MKIASRSTHRAFFHGTIVIKGGAILSYGYNHGETHSERMALNPIWPNRRAGTSIINIRVTKTGKLANSRPCRDCHEFLVRSGVKRIYYSNSEGRFEEMK